MVEMETITNLLLGLFGGGGLATFITLKATKRKEDADASSSELGNVKYSLELLHKEQEENRRKDDVITELQKENANLRNEATAKGQLLCSHIGCSVRKPSYGQGKFYYDQNKDDITLGVDYTPIEDLVARAKRRPLKEKGIYQTKNEEEE